ncbi:MAG: nickel pincer cofactor biosynthesis protein LarC [Candidatus Eremiobacteraeota bacterium]|nr:nickel pincer cofactor biosynthesis protein LarC [Candidatus Eremiobacteraeota bacterium]
MSIAIFDAFGGASGNMILGALVDAGLPLDDLERELRKLPVRGWTIHTQPVHKRGLGALYLDVDVPGEDGRAFEKSAAAPAPHHHEGHPHRSLVDVLGIIRAAKYPRDVERKAVAIYERLAAAEARVHRVPVGEIAFHEVGQVDAIVDIAGAVLGLQLLGIDAVYCSPLPCGHGTVHGAHGAMPSPSPATMDLLRDVPTYAVDLDAEMVTPTGAAILTAIADFGLRPPMIVDRIGYGAGRSDFPFANVLRVAIGDAARVANGEAHSKNVPPQSEVVQIETNIDDMNPQVYGHVLERVSAAGALDVWLHPVQMKKGRPGAVVCVLAPAHLADQVSAVLLAETTTIGVRCWPVQRVVLPRRTDLVATSFGPVRIKIVIGTWGERVRPEYDDCRAIAERTGIALVEVMRRIESELDERRAQRT